MQIRVRCLHKLMASGKSNRMSRDSDQSYSLAFFPSFPRDKSFAFNAKELIFKDVKLVRSLIDAKTLLREMVWYAETSGIRTHARHVVSEDLNN